MSEPPSRIIVVAGALLPQNWLPSEEIRKRLPRLSALVRAHGLVTRDEPVATGDGALPSELAHDAWLRADLAADAVVVAPGAMTAVRRLAGSSAAHDGWLMEPVHFHLARDHLVLETRSAGALDDAAAARLTDAIRTVVSEASHEIVRIAPDRWLLRACDPSAGLHLHCASPEAAAGRNVDGYLPTGPDQRRYRRILNEIQMTWFAAQQALPDDETSPAPINSVWLSGPVSAAACDAWRARLDSGRARVDERLLPGRLHDDRGGWLDALASLDDDLCDALQAPDPTAVLLCGEASARRIAPAVLASSLPGAADAAAGSGARPGPLRRLLAALLRRPTPGADADADGGGSAPSLPQRGPRGLAPARAQPSTPDPVVRLFIEASAT